MKFTKMHGLGNDFIIVEENELSQDVDLAALAVSVCRRHKGIGADGLVVIRRTKRADRHMQIFNADGNEAESCGNALRCVVSYVHRQGLGNGGEITIEAKAGIYHAKVIVESDETTLVTIDMGEPELRPSEFPSTVGGEGPVLNQKVTTTTGDYLASLVRVGVPHVVIFVPELAAVSIAREGQEIERNVMFPQGANVNFAEQKSPEVFAVGVWERGAGLTMACGTGACAVTVAAVLSGRAKERATIALPGGELDISWKVGQAISMTGPATLVFAGEWCLS